MSAFDLGFLFLVSFSCSSQKCLKVSVVGSLGNDKEYGTRDIVLQLIKYNSIRRHPQLQQRWDSLSFTPYKVTSATK